MIVEKKIGDTFDADGVTYYWEPNGNLPKDVTPCGWCRLYSLVHNRCNYGGETDRRCYGGFFSKWEDLSYEMKEVINPDKFMRELKEIRRKEIKMRIAKVLKFWKW